MDPAENQAKKAAKDLARGLIALYAERQKRPGFAFSPDSPWQREFEESFDYTETDDQLRCIAEIKADMEKPRPMDGCYAATWATARRRWPSGRDEVHPGREAGRHSGAHTVLAQQHYATAVSRFRDFR